MIARPRISKGGIGNAALIVLAVISLGYPFLSRLPFLPACPFGADVEFASETVCSRTVGGLWRSIAVGLIAGGTSSLLALGLALFARRFGEVVDQFITKAADLFFAIPDVLVLIGIGFVVRLIADTHNDGKLPDPLLVMSLSLAAVGWAAPTRMIRNRLRSLERQDFVLAAEALGATRWRILVKHLLPYAREYVLAIFLLRVPATILSESTVSFLGFGMPPDRPSLGTYIGQNYKAILRGEMRVVLPAWLLLIVVVIAFQWTGQSLLRRPETKTA